MANFSRHDKHRSLKALRWPLIWTRAGMIGERLVHALWPLFSVVLLALAALMLGLQDIVPIEIVWASVVLVTLGALAALVFAMRRFRLPSREEAIDRLDASLKGRPIRALMDEQAIGDTDAASTAVWRAHQARMADRAAGAQPVAPEIRTATRDPYALRFVAMVAFAVALLFGSVWRVGSVADLAPGSVETAAGGPIWEGWVEPPRYTGRPALYLNDLEPGQLEVPLGTLVTVRLYGELGALTVAETVSARVGEVPPASDPVQEFTIRQAGQIEIAGPGGRSWEVAVTPDAPPTVSRIGDVEAAALGEATIPFTAQDDYGVEAGEARIALDVASVDRRYGLSLAPEERPQLVVGLPVPLAGSRADFQEALVEDFSKHPWANLPVTLQLSVLDSAEQNGLSEVEQLVLPGRRFFDPMASALIEMRRDILWNRNNTARAAQIMRAAAHRPADVFRKETTQLRVNRLIRRMETLARFNLSDEMQEELAEELWGLALTIEEGDLADALERLERARERLEEAMRNGASPDEIAELMRELRQATEDYLNQMRRQAELDAEENGDTGAQQQQNENSMTMTQDDIQRMMDRIQELMEQGRMAEAEQALQELQELLENLRMSQNGQQGQGQNPGQEAMDGLADTLREQQGLSDQAFRDLQEQFNPNAQAGDQAGNEGRNGNQGRGQSHEGQGGQGEGEAQGQGQNGQQGQPGQQGNEGEGLAQDLADRQQALRDELRRQQGSLPGQGSPEGDAARDALERAGRAMDGAEDALRQRDYAEAIDNQSRAMDALRDAMRNLGEMMAQQEQNGQQGQGMVETDQQTNNRDPLGRDSGGEGGIGSDQNMLQGEEGRRRAQELLDEIRRRSAETQRPEEERDYLKRLLDRF
ncbi:TIGR02302 family protein [Aliishimia ponticola]|uniref:TIGR02302 family protein n=1 Tax=Aliishimia ponticola TaxID=2499833 RepID=A0A4S4N9V9_9RHOB|nr:TIGR02302 family protein [Aliishimia ponticola]THH36046.1 TIGR02302 family protein [Aliishimia ponticola]